MTKIYRGEVWLVDLNPTRGHEQKGHRPALIISEDRYNQSKADLVIVLPITSTRRPLPTQVYLDPPEGGLKNPSALLCDAVRSVSVSRLKRCWGKVSDEVLIKVEDRLRILMGL